MKTIEVRSPFDQHLIKTLPMHAPAQAEEALFKAHTLFNDRSRWLSKVQRLAILKEAHRIAKDRQEELAKTAAEEGGKPLIDSLVEARRAVSGFEIAAEYLASMKGVEIPMQTTPESLQHIAFTRHEPRGVVLAISAFNHPLNLIVHQVIPAIAVGCPVIVKPASKTPLSCYNVLQILLQAGLPPDWCQILLIDNDMTTTLASDPRISFLSFIGSNQVGWRLRSKLPPGAACTLEHGGSAPVIIEPDADICEAIPQLVKGGFYHAGQVCVSVQRIYVHHSIVDDFSDQFVKATAKLIVGDPLAHNTAVGPLITASDVNRVDEWIHEAVAAGAQLLCGGKRLSNNCYQPTILLNPPEDARVSTHEVFGPVVCIYAYDQLEAAIKRANAPFFCFQAAIYTKNIDVAFEAASKLSATTVLINEQTAFRMDWTPFGGCKDSGLGMGGIPYSMEEMCFEKMMIIKSKAL